MNEKTIKRLQALPRVSIKNGITYYIIPQEEYEKLKAKEQECEKLKEAIDRLLKIQYQLADSCTKYEQTLTEIKEIAEGMNEECFYDDFDCMNCDMQNGCTYFNKKQILQKSANVRRKMTTNREKLAKMTNEELTRWLGGIINCKLCPCKCDIYKKCTDNILQWLNRENEE